MAFAKNENAGNRFLTVPGVKFFITPQRGGMQTF